MNKFKKLKLLEKIFFFIIGFVLISLLLLSFIPVKFAVTKQDIDKSRDYYFAERQKSTVAQWAIISENGKKTYKNCELIGNVPEGYNYDFECGHNTFVLYGKYNYKKDFYGEEIYVFNVDDWDVLYPIKRESIFILPKSYMTILDLHW